MNWLLTTDLHGTDRPKDAYRFGLYPWLVKQQKKFDITATFILGDLCENKDRHPAGLVNKTIAGLKQLKPPVYILCGNHDYINPASPFFDFLNYIRGLHFVGTQTWCLINKQPVAFIPHCHKQANLDYACKKAVPKSIFMLHNTFDGALAESNTRLTGLRSSAIELAKPLRSYSGDVHRPQQCGPVAYIGAPYHVRFGDNFTPRVLLRREGQESDLHFDCPYKWALQVRDAVDIENNNDLRKGDQVKLVIELAPEEMVEWQKIKRDILSACRNRGLEVFGAKLKAQAPRRERIRLEGTGKTPADILSAFCKSENVPGNIKDTGHELLNDV